MLAYFLLTCLASLEAVDGSPAQKRLYQQLFESYDTRVRPVVDDWETTNVTLRLNIYQLVSIKEKEQHIEISGWINQVHDIKWDK